MTRGLKFLVAALFLGGAGVCIVNAFVEGCREIQNERERERPIAPAPRVSVEDGHAVVEIDSAAQRLAGIEVFESRDGKIPESAIVHLDGKEWIYLKKDETQFVRKEIPAGGILKPADLLVVTGAQMILSEEFRAQISGEE